MLVPTKNPDNDDRAASPTSITSLSSGTQQRQGRDAFLYYSNDEVRINALKLRGDGLPVRSTCATWKAIFDLLDHGVKL